MKKILKILLTIFFVLLVYPVFADEEFTNKLIKSAIERTEHNITYNGGYYNIKYPNGDVPSNIGVCTDVVIRSYRKVGIDLQKEVHEDMKANFSLYPKIWGLKKTDTNIDHRRVANLQVFFSRHGKVLPISQKPNDYKPGDIVTWNIARFGNLPHIGIISNKKVKNTNRYYIIHNIGQCPKLEDMLFDYKITGHYRYSK